MRFLRSRAYANRIDRAIAPMRHVICPQSTLQHVKTLLVTNAGIQDPQVTILCQICHPRSHQSAGVTA